MTYVIHDSPVPICIYRFRPTSHALRPGKPALTKKHSKLARANARYPCGSCSFPRLIRSRFPPREEPQTINPSPEWKDPALAPPLRGGELTKVCKKLSQVLCETFQRATFHARKKILSTEPALQVQRTRTNNLGEDHDSSP